MRRLREPATAAEIDRRQKLLESAARFREKTPLIPGDIKDWIRAERGEVDGG
ncbi:MAG TPA: hypothetical protein VFZ25_14155 [Chloroflexota bacterium]|nr:hypothetical protein [Chloroflexota bacterium]